MSNLVNEFDEKSNATPKVWDTIPPILQAGQVDRAQLFLPGDCSALLPVGSVSQRRVFWRLTVIDTDIDFSAIVNELQPPNDRIKVGIGRARLGLPLGLVSPAWSKMLAVKATKNLFNQPITASSDGTFLPSVEPEALVESRMRLPIIVRDLDQLEKGEFLLSDNQRLSIVPKAMEVLLSHGQAYARVHDKDGDPVALVPIVLETEEADVDISGEIPAQLVFSVAGNEIAVQLSDAQRTGLASGTIITIRKGPNAIRLTPRANAGAVPQFQTLAIRDRMEEALRDMRDMLDGRGLLPDQTTIKPWVGSARKLPKYEIGIATPIEQNWELLGYERGPLVGSIVLEPGAEATVEVFTWERLRIQREEETGTSFESNAEVSALTRATSRVTMDTATELGTTFSFGGGATIPVDAVAAELKVNVETQTAINSSVASGLERVSEITRKSAEKFQSTHQVKVIHTTERGTETRSTRKISNPNAGRTVEFLHFSIQERHNVVTRIGGKAKLVAFVENPSLGAFDIGFVFAHEHVLKAALMSDDYRAGFAAARTIAAQSWFEESLVKKEKERAAKAASAADLAVAAGGAQSSPVPGIPKTGIYQSARQIKDALKEFIDIDLSREAEILWKNLNPFEEQSKKPSKESVKKAEARFLRWSFWTKFSTAYPGIEDKANSFVKLKFDGQGHATNEEVVAALQALTDGLEDDWMASIKMIAVAVVAGTAGSLIGGPLAGLLQPFLIGLLFLSDDMGLPRVITRARQELHAERALLHGAAMAAPADDATAASSGAEIPTPPQIFSDAELASAQADFGKLKRHLEAHRSYYENAIWSNEDPNDRFIRLEITGLSPFVENVLIGFVGNRAMYPLRLQALPDTTQEKIKSMVGSPLVDGYENQFDVSSEYIVLPTPAVHCEAYLGACELLEPYLVRRREIDLMQREAALARAEAVAEQERQEALRFAARLAQTPPQLDSPGSSRPGYSSRDADNPNSTATDTRDP